MRVRTYNSLIVLIRNALMAVTVFGVLFSAGVQLMAVRYICSNSQAWQFINTISHIPKKPELVFLGCVISMLALGIVMYIRQPFTIESFKWNMCGVVLEAACGLAVSCFLNFSYPAVFLMIFCDSIFHFRHSPKGKWISVLVAGLYFFASYPIVNLMFPMMNTEAFFTVFGGFPSVLLQMIKGLSETVIIVLCVSFIGLFLTWQIAENDNIAQELSMVSQVNQELKNYAAVTEKIGEDKERKRLAREIHDTLGHALTGIAAGIDACTAIIDKNPQAAKKQLMLVSTVVRQGISDVRTSLKKLRPGALEEQGLKGALKKMIDEFTAVSSVEINFVFEADQADFDVAKEDVLFRMIQESMTNSIRHGHAKKIDIHLFIEKEELKVVIFDDGIGCKEITCGYGLLQMQERIQTIHGHIEFDGSCGFKTTASLPLMKGERIR